MSLNEENRIEDTPAPSREAPMSLNRPKSGLVLGLAALAALVVALQPKPAGHAPSAEEGATAAADQKPPPDAHSADAPVAEGPTKPIWDFVARTPAKAESRNKRYSAELSGRGVDVFEEPDGHDSATTLYDWPTCCDLEGYSFRFLIATVPDPLDSGFGYEFDQVLEALQRAIEADDYVIDRSWLPWPDRASTARDSARRYQRHPGLILFRDDSAGEGRPTRRLLALLLVGETPTAGIHKVAFRHAVRVIHSCPGYKVEGNRVRVLGPYFSGSAVSLGLALREVRDSMKSDACRQELSEPWIKVVCGSASAFSHRDFVNSGWRADKDNKDDPAFATTILPNELLLDWLRRYLGDPVNPTKGQSPAPIVVLHEANTSFGHRVPRTAGGTPTAAAAEKPELILVPFPLHISQLRASYTKEQLARAESLGMPRIGRNLPFPTEDPAKGEKHREVLPVRAPLLTAAIDDLILDNVVTTMAQKRARYACLVSTDVRDTIFLAREIHDRYPDIQLATLGSDLLLTHEDYNPALRGMIVASTYPLYPPVQGWSDQARDQPQAARVLFAQDGYQGCYNAALVHLLNKDNQKKLLPFLMDYGWEGTQCDVTMPPLWLSVVGGNGQLIPITYVAPADYARDLEWHPDLLDYFYRRPRLASAPKQMEYGRLTLPNTWFISFAVLFGVNVWLFRRLCRYLRRSEWHRTVADRSARYKQRIDFAVGCLAQVLLYGMMAELAVTPMRVGLHHHDGSSALAVSLVFLGSLGMVAASWIKLLTAYRQEVGITGLAWRQRWAAYHDLIQGSQIIRRLPPWLGRLARGGFWIMAADLFMLALVTAAVVCFAWRIFSSFLNDLPSQKVLYFERTVHLTNGVSSLLPRILYCAALFGWSYFLVKKLHLANHYSVECPFPCNGSAHFNGVRGLHGDIRSELMPPSTLQRHFYWCLLMFVLALICFGKLHHDAAPPVDGVAFGDWALFGFFAGSFLLLFTLLQFQFAWRSLRKMLRFVALLPMQSAFERLADKVVGTFGHYLYSLRPRHSHLGIDVQLYQRVHRLFPAFCAKLQHAVLWKLSLGQVDNDVLNTAWHEVQRTFPHLAFGPAIDQQFDRELNPVNEEEMEPPAGSPVLEWGGVTGEDVHQLAENCLRVLYPFWPTHTMEEAFGRALPDGESAEHSRRASGFLSLPRGDAVREWLVAAEDFVAVEIIRYLSQFIVQLRNLLTCLTVSSLLLILAATVYPFYPQHLLLLLLAVLAGSIALLILVFLVQLNRDELISRIIRGTPNRFTPDWSFLQSAAAYVLPIVAAVMVQFPLVTSTLRSLFDPLFHIIK